MSFFGFMTWLDFHGLFFSFLNSRGHLWILWRCTKHGNARVSKNKSLTLKFFSFPSTSVMCLRQTPIFDAILNISYKSLTISDFHIISSLCCGKTPSPACDWFAALECFKCQPWIWKTRHLELLKICKSNRQLACPAVLHEGTWYCFGYCSVSSYQKG